MYYIGIDIGSTSAKTVVLDNKRQAVKQWIQPTGWSSIDTAQRIKEILAEYGIDAEENPCIATGYGRVSVPYADKMITEITCHAIGAAELFGVKDAVIIDIGGQDTKVIRMKNGMVADFTMNDKCSAGTGRFLEIMANSLAMKPAELCEMAAYGSGVTISSMCTVFAESEITSLIGSGEKKENIAYAIVDSIVEKVASQAARMIVEGDNLLLTGGLCECAYLRCALEKKLEKPILTKSEAKLAGAFGAALNALNIKM